ncbi:MAG: prepilin-type N-terminal cleavage/methylation domain-containing protein [Elusimicrobiaceae bacterium]|nr:prepilin-type N-terminal cleavage/methylation domain-containing protein [Elusimicrobiaceae bacterium]
MNNNKSIVSCKQGFTLIELLVVVLIVGILAAVAVPQYQVAVGKSRYMQLILLGKAVYNAQMIYYTAHGSYATKIQDLDLDFQFPASVEYRLADGYAQFWYKESDSLRYFVFFPQKTGECRVVIKNELSKKICRSVTGKELRDLGSYWSVYF